VSLGRVVITFGGCDRRVADGALNSGAIYPAALREKHPPFEWVKEVPYSFRCKGCGVRGQVFWNTEACI